MPVDLLYKFVCSPALYFEICQAPKHIIFLKKAYLQNKAVVERKTESWGH